MTPSLHVALFTIATHLPTAMVPRGLSPEPPEYREARIDTISLAIDDVTNNPEEAAATLTVMYGESKLDPIIHAGGIHPVWTQDKGRARCLSQLHKSGQVPEWATLAGTDYEATRRCALATIRVLRSSAWKCRVSLYTPTEADMARVFAEYGLGAGFCRPTVQSMARARMWAGMRSQLWNEVGKKP